MSSDPRPEPPPPGAETRTLPNSLEAERAVLGTILVHDGAYLAVADILARDGSDFYRDAHRRIYVHMLKLLDRPGGGLDYLVLTDALARAGEMDEIGGVSYLMSLLDGATRATNVKHYATIVREKAHLRAVIRTAQALEATAYEQEQDAAEMIDLADRAILGLRQRGGTTTMLSLRESAGAFETDLSWRMAHKGELFGVPSGLSGIDAETGGWEDGNVIIIAARPSMGKTALVLKCARAAAELNKRGTTRRHRVALFSMEMSRLELERRILSDLSGIAATRLKNGFIAEHEMERLAEARARMTALNLYIDDTPGLTAEEIRARCRSLIADGGLDLVIIDYVQLMPGSLARKSTNRNEEITDLSRKLKKTAGEFGVPFLVLSQLKRADGRPQLTDLRDSGSLEQDADLVCFVHRSDHRKSGPTEFIIAKARNGPTGTVPLTFNRDIQRFEDAPEEPDEPPPPETERPEPKRRPKSPGYTKRSGGD